MYCPGCGAVLNEMTYICIICGVAWEEFKSKPNKDDKINVIDFEEL